MGVVAVIIILPTAALCTIGWCRGYVRGAKTWVQIMLTSFAVTTDIWFVMQTGLQGEHSRTFFLATLSVLVLAMSLAAHVIVGMLVVLCLAGRAGNHSRIQPDTVALVSVDKLRDASMFYAALLCLALTNSDLLRLLPWTSHKYDDFPSATIFLLCQMTTLLEDVPQFFIQLSYLVGWDGVDESALFVPVLSLTFSSISLVWRVLHKCLRIVTAAADTERVRKSLVAGKSNWAASHRPPSGSARTEPSIVEMGTPVNDAEAKVTSGEQPASSPKGADGAVLVRCASAPKSLAAQI